MFFTVEHNGTYIDGSSDAANSKLWVKNFGVWVPPNPGFPGGLSAFSYTLAANTHTTTGTYNCGGAPPPVSGLMPITGLNTSTANSMSSLNTTIDMESEYIQNTGTYRYLDANPNLKNNNAGYTSFYTAQANTSIKQFKQVEASLSAGQYAQAQSLNSWVKGQTLVETNYKNYYSLQAKYKLGSLNAADSLMLTYLAQLCPGTNGAIVYQARALYNVVYNTIKQYTENCEAITAAATARFISPEHEAELETNYQQNNWQVDVFPNPGKGNFNVVSQHEQEVLYISIVDMAGKLIYKNTITTNHFIANLELNAKAGVYTMSIKNANHESLIKKLVIVD